MSRFKSSRSPALADDRREQVLSDLLKLREGLASDVTNLKIGSDDYNALSQLILQIVDAGIAVSGESDWVSKWHRTSGWK